MNAENIKGLKARALEIRKMILDICCKAGTGHITSSFSCIEILTALFHGGLLSYDPDNPDWPDRDRFILSKGQASPALYVVLADAGYFPKEDLESFCAKKGKFGVHLQHSVPGAEITSGSLGMGFGIAAGMALSAKLNNQLYMVFSMLGDGECYEGSIWETAMFAGHKNLNNLVAIIDRNYLCATNFTENMLSIEPLRDKWQAFGWEVVEINGHSFEEIMAVFKGLRSRKSKKPTAIIAETVKGEGIPFMCYDPLCHAVTPIGQKAEKAKRELQVRR